MLPGISLELATAISNEAAILFNEDEAIVKQPTLQADGPQKYLVAAKGYNKRGMYECVAHKDHVPCSCPLYKYNCACKHSICVAEKMSKLLEPLKYLSERVGRGKPKICLLVGPEAEEGAGKKRGKAKNHWRLPRQDSSGTTRSGVVDSPFTKVYHNNRPLLLCFLQDCPKAIKCKQCLFEFPRRPIILPLDILLVHEERWMYPDPNNKGQQLPSAKYTTKFYCVKRSCILARFPYFNNTFLEIPIKS